MVSRIMRSRRQVPQQPEQQPRARWTNDVTKVFLDMMVDQVQRGNRISNSFSKKAWKHMSAEFYRKTSLRWDLEQLKSKYAVLRRQYAIASSLLERSEFSLDECTGMISANDEAWAAYIKERPDAETIRSSGCPMYEQLCMIFSEPMTNGKHRQEGGIPSACSKVPLNTMEEESSSSESDEADDVADDQDTYQPPTYGTSATTAIRKRGRKGIEDAIAAGLFQMAAASKLRTAAIRQINARYSIADCIKQLDEIQRVKEEVYFAALDLFKKPSAREIFLSLKVEKRLIWLCSKCTGNPVL
ncbi:hypothetical protein POTOM_028283 [Populus tomentosa]|uniref:Myb/SANT-like domain-containing protein n=1 Tax=Populus tomentosa TaxID=118781 RepID=A0A8X8CVM2_POPTO|nr:hypothetical protein POTOM_028283 [Populus tomentosa]